MLLLDDIDDSGAHLASLADLVDFLRWPVSEEDEVEAIDIEDQFIVLFPYPNPSAGYGFDSIFGEE